MIKWGVCMYVLCVICLQAEACWRGLDEAQLRMLKAQV